MKPNSKINSQVMKFKQKYYSRKHSLQDLFSDLKHDYSFSDTIDIISSLSGNPIDVYIYGNPLPSSYNNLLSLTQTNTLSKKWEIEFSWHIHSIRKYADKINRFLVLKEEFDDLFIKGHYNEAEIILDTMHSEVGVSIWYMEKELLIKEYAYGLEKNKELLTHINTINDGIFAAVLSYHFSQRAEKNLSVDTYEQALRTALGNIDESISFLREYFNFHLSYFNHWQEFSSPRKLLFFEGFSSVIDRYLTCLYTAQVLSINPQADKQFLYKYALKLHRAIKDPLLDNLLLRLDPNFNFSTTACAYKIANLIDEYTHGSYDNCIDHAKELIKTYPSHFLPYEIYTKSRIHQEYNYEYLPVESPFANELLYCLHTLYFREGNINEALEWIKKTINTLGMSEISYNLYGLFLQELNRIDYNKFSPLELLNTKAITPNFVQAYDNPQAKELFFNNINDHYHDSITIELIKNQHLTLQENQSLNIDATRMDLYNAHVLAKKGEYLQAISIYEEVYSTAISKKGFKNYYIIDQLIGRLFACYLNAALPEKCLPLIVMTYFENRNLIHAGIFDRFYHYLSQNEYCGLDSDIHLPIFVYFYTNDTRLIYVALDNFLVSHDLEKPSDLFSIKDIFNKDRFVYLLQHICVPGILSHMPYFSNTDEMEKERILICQKLKEIDQENVLIYSNEISQITQRQFIRKCIQRIDESKIYVDTDGIKASYYKSLKESFDRYKEFAKFDAAKIKLLDIYRVLFNLRKEEDLYKEITKSFYSTNRPCFIIFQDLFLELRDRFISSNEYGLDSYLSVRIRHGTLLGQMRRAFEAENLITLKDTQNNTYGYNSHWGKLYSCESKEVDGQVQEWLADLSRKLDEIIEKVKTNWLHVKTENRETNGLFDFSYDSESILRLHRELLDSDIEYEDFINGIFIELWNRAEVNLTYIRKIITNDLTAEIFQLLTDLYEKMRSNSRIRDISSELYSAITKCRTNIQNDLEIIARWFTRSQGKHMDQFVLSNAIKTSIEIMRNNFPSIKFNPDVKIESDINIEGKYFEPFIDILNILFNNVILHSGLEGNAIKTQVSLYSNMTELTLLINNNLSNNQDATTVSEKLNTIITNIQSSDIGDKVRTEGGTGIWKLFKILKYDLKRKNYAVSFGPDNTKAIFVKVTMETTGLNI